MAFSATLTLSDLNDYLAPSQACIRPVEEADPVEQIVDGAKTEIQIDAATGAYFETAGGGGVGIHDLGAGSSGQRKKLKKAEISLNDCLACSGCITTSQELLLQTHSLAPLLRLLPAQLSAGLESMDLAASSSAATATDPLTAPSAPSTSTQPTAPLDRAVAEPKAIFLSLSPQSLASLSAALPDSLALDPPSLLRSLAAFMPKIGIGHVSDTTFARHIALSETVAEFASRRSSGASSRGPVLASACPGWVCYAEKAHGEVLPFLGRARSPLGIQGALVKAYWARQKGWSSGEVYHVAVQPCPDRKLESSRTSFRVPAGKSSNEGAERVPETDLVLSTDEFAQLLERAGFDPAVAAASTSVTADGNGFLLEGLPQDVRHPGSSSDGYLHAILGHVAGSYDPTGTGGLVLAETPIRGSADYVEYVLSVGPEGVSAPDVPSTATLSPPPLPPGTVLLRAAACYGFKNLQNVVRKTKLAAKASASRLTASARANGGRTGGSGAGAGAYDYVEVMACPSGCVNGGGQLKPPSVVAAAASTSPSSAVSASTVDVETRWSTKAHVALVESVYQNEPRPSISSASTPLSVGPPPKPVKRPLADSAFAFERQLDPTVRAQADALERVVRAEMDAFCRAHPDFYARSSSAADANAFEGGDDDGGQSGSDWRRTIFERIDPAESDGGLLGSGVVW